jgi:predicted dehydrogenase
MAQVRVAVIGAGLIGRTHIGVLRSGNPDYTLAAVADPSPAAAAEGQSLGYPVYAGSRRCWIMSNRTVPLSQCRTRCT